MRSGVRIDLVAWFVVAMGLAIAPSCRAAQESMPALSKSEPSPVVAAAHAPQIIATLSPLANFVYQLDCLAGWLHSCGGRGEYVALWRDRFGVDAARSRDVEAWRATFVGGSDLLNRARIASFEATSADDYLRRIAVLFPAASARRVAAVVHAHYPAFLRWWRSSDPKARDARVRALQHALAGEPIAGELPKLYRFFAVPADASRTLHLALLYRPAQGALPVTTGEFIGDDWSVAKFGATEDLANRLGVVVHEYTHYVYAKMRPDDRKALGAAIVDADAVHGAAAWSLFNEAIATAVGNGRIYRWLATPEAWSAMLARDRSLYADAPIDAAAKAILPLVDTTLDEGGSVTSSGFAKAYDETLDAHLGSLWRAPSLVLGEFKALADDRLGDSYLQDAIRTFGAHSVWYDTKPCCGADFEKWWKDNAGSTRLVLIAREHAKETTLLDADTAARFAALPDHQAGYVITRNGEWTDIVIVATKASAHTAFAAIAGMASLEPGTYYASSHKGDAAAAVH